MEQGLPPLAAEVNGTLTDPAPSLDPVTPPATASSAIGKLAVTVLALVVFVPVGLVGALVFFVCWSVATVLCVGPCLQAYFSKRDNRLLAREKLLLTHPTLVAVPIAVGINSASSGSYTVVARVTLPSVGARSSSLSLPPVIFPGGLAATQIFMARAQDQLSAAGHVTVAVRAAGALLDPPLTLLYTHAYIAVRSLRSWLLGCKHDGARTERRGRRSRDGRSHARWPRGYERELAVDRRRRLDGGHGLPSLHGAVPGPSLRLRVHRRHAAWVRAVEQAVPHVL